MDETPVDATRKYVQGLIWPANKDEVIRAVQRNGAPDDVVQMLQSLDKPRFRGPNEVQNALWLAS